MSFRFPHVFTGLMILSGLCAFVIPQRATLKVTPNIQALFAPVAWPAKGIGRWFAGRFGASDWNDRRTADTLREENSELRAMVSNLAARLEVEAARNQAWSQVGAALRQRGMVVPVVGGDAGTRQALQIPRNAAALLKVGQCVFYPGGIVGIVDRAGVGGAQIRLITDVGFRISGRFARLRRNAAGRLEWVNIATPGALLEGAGNNTLHIRQSLTMEDVVRSELNKDPASVWAVVADRDWPEVLSGQPIAQVEKIAPSSSHPLFAEITLKPATNLQRLSEVLVIKE